MISTRPASRDSTRDAQANPYTAYTSVVVWRATSCSVIHSTPSMSVSAMLTVAMASPVKCPGNTDRISMPAATSMISMRQRNEKLSRLRFTMNHQMMNRLITTTPIWWTTRCSASMGTGSPAGKPREMPSAKPEHGQAAEDEQHGTARLLCRRSAQGAGCGPTSVFMARW